MCVLLSFLHVVYLFSRYTYLYIYCGETLPIGIGKERFDAFSLTDCRGGFERRNARRFDNRSNEGKTRPDARARVRGIATRTRENETAMRIRTIVRPQHHTGA